MTTDRRLIEWIDLVGDLLNRPMTEFPREELGRQLGRTFDVHGVSWDWRERSGHAGYESWPDVDAGRLTDLPPVEHQRILERHPLLQWFVVTRDATPQSTGRVPSAVASERDRAFIDDYLKPLDWDQQLSIPYLLDGPCYATFILGRPDEDFDDDDLELAAHLQHLIRGLYLQTTMVDRHPDGVARRCGSADRVGLTASELAVLTLLAEGRTTYGIARCLETSPRTVSKHLEHIYRKLGVTHRLAAVFAAQEAGLLTAPEQVSPV